MMLAGAGKIFEASTPYMLLACPGLELESALAKKDIAQLSLHIMR